MDLVSFEAAGMRFLVDAARVREVARTGEHARDRVDRGWIEIRGERVPVVELGARLGGRDDAAGARGADPPRGGGAVLVLDHPVAGTVALQVDMVGEVRRTGREQIAPLPAIFAGAAGWMSGLVAEGDRFAVVVDAAELPVR